jgi:hypothetical protein
MFLKRRLEKRPGNLVMTLIVWILRRIATCLNDVVTVTTFYLDDDAMRGIAEMELGPCLGPLYILPDNLFKIMSHLERHYMGSSARSMHIAKVPDTLCHENRHASLEI